MSDSTNIEWTDSTWNPIAGCSIVSPGCTNCYAMKMAARIERMGTAPHYAGLTKPSKGGAVWTGKIAVAPDHMLIQPLRWKKPRKIFVNSMSDLFHEDVSDETIDQVFAVMALAPQHIFQVLTKRPERMRRYLSEIDTPARIASDGVAKVTTNFAARDVLVLNATWPLPNVWLGTSVEDQRRADERIPELLATPAAVRWISAEPLLGPIYIPEFMPNKLWSGLPSWTQPELDWVVVGGESGPGARPMHPDWARSLRDQCEAAGVPYLFKQWGNWTPGENVERQSGRVKVAHWFDDRWSIGAENLAAADGHVDDQPDLYEVGKHAAGRLLDGVAHDGYPAAGRGGVGQ